MSVVCEGPAMAVRAESEGRGPSNSGRKEARQAKTCAARRLSSCTLPQTSQAAVETMWMRQMDPWTPTTLETMQNHLRMMQKTSESV